MRPRARRIAGQLGRSQPGQEGHGHRAGLVDGQVRHEPLEGLVVADEQADPVAAAQPRAPQAPGEPIGAPVPLAQA